MSVATVAEERCGVLVPRGFRAGAAAAHIRDDGDTGRLDVGLVVSDLPATAAGVFTRNRLKAAPVVISQLTLRRRSLVQAIVVNSGNANACTGAQGFRDALRMASAAGDALDLAPHEVLVCSTGVIGRAMPIDRVLGGIAGAARLGDSTGADVARAIMTTDTMPKVAAAQFDSGGVSYSVGGVAKGAGMLHPDMATLLAFITTDVAADHDVLQAALQRAADTTFNCVTVDGDTSPNDTVLLLANGAAGGPRCEPDTELHERFSAALDAVCEELAEQLVADAEGATRHFRVTVAGTASDEEARSAARTVAGSPLVKTAVHGADPNWGRIVAALGRSGADFVLDRCSVSIGGITVLQQGIPQVVDLQRVSEALRRLRVDIDISLGDGGGSGHCWGCDLTADYVRINAEYTT
jgi:glutamate N-acetyltransferase/amino-acid N-acetyltransferase